LASQLKAEGRDVIGLGAGEPDFDTPEHIREAAIAAIRNGDTHYTAVDGTVALKQAIVDKFRRDNGLTYQADQILVSCGGKQSFFNLCQALLDAGDEVIIPAPYWVSYPDMVRLADAEPVIVPTTAAQGFLLQAEALEAAITGATRLVILNSPGNPTGAMYTREQLALLGRVLERHRQVLILSDEIYEHIQWTGAPYASFAAACPALQARTVTVNGMSKAYAMSGWRIGYAAGPRELIGDMATIQSQSTTNACSISQAAAVAALDGDQSCVRQMCREFQQRHDSVQPLLLSSILLGYNHRPVTTTILGCFRNITLFPEFSVQKSCFWLNQTCIKAIFIPPPGRTRGSSL
jgi:aspartate aminotransferase